MSLTKKSWPEYNMVIHFTTQSETLIAKIFDELEDLGATVVDRKDVECNQIRLHVPIYCVKQVYRRIQNAMYVHIEWRSDAVRKAYEAPKRQVWCVNVRTDRKDDMTHRIPFGTEDEARARMHEICACIGDSYVILDGVVEEVCCAIACDHIVSVTVSHDYEYI